MQNQNQEFINLLQKQKSIRILFVILNILAWYGDNITQKNLIANKKNTSSNIQQIYNSILIISIIINIYYILTIKKQIKNAKEKKENTNQLEIRKNALIILVIALSILLYSQVSLDKN